MTVEEYRERMIDAFHNADCDSLIALVVQPTEKEFEHLEWLLKTHYKRRDNMELKDTIEMMQSEDFKERFKAEYYQTKIRYDKLHTMVVKYEAGTLNFTPKCSIDILKEQASYMGRYLYTLEVRAQIEGIELTP